MKDTYFTINTYDKLPSEFIDLPKHIFRNEENFTKPLDLDVKKNLDFDKHPYWKGVVRRIFVASKNGELLGRGMAIYNPKHFEVHGERAGFFGFLDTVNNQEIFNELLEYIKNFLKQNECTKMVGPLNPSINYELGVLTSGYNLPNFYMMAYNPPYYMKLYDSAGFDVEAEFSAFKTANVINLERINRVRSLIQKKYKAEIKEFNYSNFKNSVRQICEIYNDAFKDHYGYLPMSFDEFYYIAKDMKLIMDKRLLYLVTVNGEVVGFILALPNLNEVIAKLKNGKLNLLNLLKFLYYKRKIKHVKVMIAAIKQKYTHMGLGSLLYSEMACRVYNFGYKGAEIGWVSSENVKMLKAVKDMGGVRTKTYALYSKEIK